MQLGIINEGTVSTCRGCDRQTYHSHISIQLEVRWQKELSTRVQTSQQGWALCLLFWIQNYSMGAKKKSSFFFFTMLCLKLNKQHLHHIISKILHFDSWIHGMSAQWMDEIHIFLMCVKPMAYYEGYTPCWTLQHLRKVVDKRKK